MVTCAARDRDPEAEMTESFERAKNDWSGEDVMVLLLARDLNTLIMEIVGLVIAQMFDGDPMEKKGLLQDHRDSCDDGFETP